MTISGLSPYAALSGSTPLAQSTARPLASSSALPGMPLNGASAGAVERPGIGTRLMSAMRAAVSELRGTPTGGQQTMLAMQAPVSLSPTTTPAKPKPAAKPKHPGAKTWIDKAGNVRQVGTGAVLKANPKASNPPTEPAGVAPRGPQAPVVGSQLPTNAAQLPGATVYSYDQYGNPVAPTMQQLGMTPTMLQGLEGMAGSVDPDGPQMNATNQTSLGLGNGLGAGSAVPVLGQPIAITPASTAAASGSTGARQSVANENVTDVSSRNQGVVGGWGGSPWGGVATPSAPYGSSMTGAYALGNGSRLF
jgi:hypothetical protein